jgi:RNA polymerase sigma-70 factor (ECF subfamily)
VTPEPDEQFQRMWEQFSPAVLRYARRRVAPADVDDVVAETFVVAWRRLAEAPSFPLPWLFAIARGGANARRGDQRREALQVRLVQQPAGVAPEADADHPDAVAALARLGQRDRELLTLLAWDDLTPQEAASALGISHAAVRVRLHRARRRFLALVGDADPPPDDERSTSTTVPTTSGAH